MYIIWAFQNKWHEICGEPLPDLGNLGAKRGGYGGKRSQKCVPRWSRATGILYKIKKQVTLPGFLTNLVWWIPFLWTLLLLGSDPYTSSHGSHEGQMLKMILGMVKNETLSTIMDQYIDLNSLSSEIPFMKTNMKLMYDLWVWDQVRRRCHGPR